VEEQEGRLAALGRGGFVVVVEPPSCLHILRLHVGWKKSQETRDGGARASLCLWLQWGETCALWLVAETKLTVDGPHGCGVITRADALSEAYRDAVREQVGYSRRGTR
jgi:hypothetical protein